MSACANPAEGVGGAAKKECCADGINSAKNSRTTLRRQVTWTDIEVTITLLAELYPQTFAVYEGRRKPLQIGIRERLFAELNGAVTTRELCAALSAYTKPYPYQKKLVEGAPRIGLDGQPAGTVTAEEAASARERAARLNELRRARQALAAAAETPASPPPPAPKRLSLADLKAAARARKNGGAS
jgi:sRNA-binding protein